MIRRRLVLAAIVLAVAAQLILLLGQVLAPGGWTAAKVLMLGAFAAIAPWFGFCAAQGLTGFWLLLTGRLRGEPPEDPVAVRVAIAVTIRNEDMGIVLPPLRDLLDALDRSGQGGSFTLFLLSDTGDPALAAAEAGAIAAFRAADTRPDRIRYRRRDRNDGFKAGNIMAFLDAEGQGFDVMVVLDADSRMSARAVLRLVRTLQAEPHLAIVQHLTVGVPAVSAFPRLFQYGMRPGMRTWATALAWWQGDSACYWGHNAAVQIAPFRAHCRLPLLPGGRPILSHDQVEAALLTGAGWGVRLLPEEDGSFEINPPALPEHLRRELRWMAGNLEYRHLLGMPGLRAMGRWQLVQAILLFGTAPFHLLFLLGAAWAAATDASGPFPAGWALAVAMAWLGALYAPKWLGFAAILLRSVERRRHGGAWRILVGMAAETAFTLLLDPVLVTAKTVVMLRLLTGRRPGWLPQNRSERGVSWAEAARLCWPQTVLGLAVFACFARAGLTALLWAAPFAGGLLLAIPFCVLTAAPGFGVWLRMRGVAAVPEEVSSGQCGSMFLTRMKMP